MCRKEFILVHSEHGHSITNIIKEKISPEHVKSEFTPKEVRSLVNISYRQLKYWDKSGFISPSLHRDNKYRLYTFSDLIQLKLAETLKDKSYSVQRLRKTMTSVDDLLTKIGGSLSELSFLIDQERILVFNGRVDIKDSNGYVRFDAANLKKSIDSLFPDTIDEKYSLG